MAQGAANDLYSNGEVKLAYPRRKPMNISSAEALELDDKEVTGDRNTPDPEAAGKRAKKATYDANHEKGSK